LVEQRSNAFDFTHGMPLGTAMRATERFTDRILKRYEPTLKTLASALIKEDRLEAMEIEELLVDELNDKELQDLVRSKLLGGVNHA
jgi:hypothetical protein